MAVKALEEGWNGIQGHQRFQLSHASQTGLETDSPAKFPILQSIQS